MPGLTYEDVANELGLQREQVRRIEATAIRKLRDHYREHPALEQEALSLGEPIVRDVVEPPWVEAEIDPSCFWATADEISVIRLGTHPHWRGKL